MGRRLTCYSSTKGSTATASRARPGVSSVRRCRYPTRRSTNTSGKESFQWSKERSRKLFSNGPEEWTVSHFISSHATKELLERVVYQGDRTSKVKGWSLFILSKLHSGVRTFWEVATMEKERVAKKMNRSGEVLHKSPFHPKPICYLWN